jgi:hypothetical protein
LENVPLMKQPCLSRAARPHSHFPTAAFLVHLPLFRDVSNNKQPKKIEPMPCAGIPTHMRDCSLRSAIGLF